jgi:hypothetical protein
MQLAGIDLSGVKGMTEMILWPWGRWEGNSETAPGEVEPGPEVEDSNCHAPSAPSP